MDLTDAITKIEELAIGNAGAKNKIAVIDLPKEPPGVYGLMNSSGTFQRIVAAVAPRVHTLNSLDQIVPLVEDVEQRQSGHCSVWYSQAGVVVLLQDEGLTSDLRSRVIVPLKHSPEFATLLQESKSPSTRDAKPFVQWLRTKLLDVLRDADEILPLLRSLKGSSQESNRLQTGRGRESMGLEVDAEIMSDLGDIPDYLIFTPRVFSDPSIQRRVTVRCALEINPRTLEVQLTPIDSDLVKAVDDELTAIGNVLKTSLRESVPVFFGTP